jgi:hypothetical protein
VQQQVLDRAPHPDLRIYTVWVPMMVWDSQANAGKAASLISDDRVEHFWTPDLELGNVFAGPLGLAGEPAWDVYLLYGSQALWHAAPPVPDFFMHQLGDRLPANLQFDSGRMLEEIQQRIGKQAPAAERSSHSIPPSTG